MHKGYTNHAHNKASCKMTDRTDLEEKIAHLTKTVDELSDVAARQENEIARLTRQVAMLMQRSAEQELDMGGTAVMGDQRPPHY